MVKRRKPASSSVDDEKRENEASLRTNSVDGGGIENLIDVQAPLVGAATIAKNRIHVTRTCTKEVQNAISDGVEAETSSLPAEKCQKSLPGQRSSNRFPKRIRKESNSVDASVKKAVAVVSLKQNGPLRSKTRRPWELWSVEDKNAFFEALCEFGKDFENIQSYIAQRSKKKGTPINMIKNKDQVRHFYYRTWHKISKFLDINDDVRKQTQEIYGLINYAELRKKIGGCLNEKNRQKLNDLVLNGVTTVKYKGKKLRIKTPVCRALKKLNQVEEPKVPEVEKLPKEVVLELIPHTNRDWLYVQNLSQNPRVRTKVTLQHRLKTVIEYLQRRWKPYRLRKKEQILSSLTQFDASIFHNDPAPILHLRVRNNIPISMITISTMDSASSSDVCLEKHIKISKDTGIDKETVKTKKHSKLKPKVQSDISLDVSKDEQLSAFKSLHKLNGELSTDKITEENYNCNLLSPPTNQSESDDYSENPVGEAQRSLSLLISMLNAVDKNCSALVLSPVKKKDIQYSKVPSVSGATEFSSIADMYLKSYEGDETLTLGQLLGQRQYPLSPQHEEEEKSEHNVEKNLTTTLNKIEDNQTSNAEILKNGWTLDTVGLLTIGELYLMLGRPEKILLDYTIEEPGCDEKGAETKSGQADELSSVIKKLLQIAATTFSEFKNKQVPVSNSSGHRNSAHSRVNSSQSLNKSSSHCISKNSAVKKAVKSKTVNAKFNQDSVVSNASYPESALGRKKNGNTELCSTTNSLRTICSDKISSSDKHVFVVPVGTAPRTVKKPSQESLREEIDKLLPGNRRGCRVRRKPLVVQRPLLPRDGVGAMPNSRPVTLLHFVPSGSQLTTMIPSNTTAESKANLLPAKKVVKILSAGTAIDMRPLQVPLMKQVTADTRSGVILQQSTIPTAHLMMTQPITQNIGPQTLGSTINKSPSNVESLVSLEKHAMLISSTDNNQSTVSDISSLAISLPSLTSLSSCSSDVCNSMVASSPPQISIPDTHCSSSSDLLPSSVSSFLEISLAHNLSSKTPSEENNTHLLNFSDNSHLSAFELASSPVKSSQHLASVSPSCLSSDPTVVPSENTPPHSPPNHPFRINSPGPEAQWLNGEGVEFSLSSLLNTLDSPSKMLSISSSAISLGGDNSNLDPIARLAPVMDSQVRCLLDECSVDFITKFEDLADVINSSNMDSKPA